jgi:hypothetical protein
MDKLSESIQRHLSYYKTIQKQLDAHQTKAASIHLRKQWIEKQKISNYQNEYDRIRGIIDQNIIKAGPNTNEKLEKRAKHLKELGAQIIDKIG